MCVGCSKKLTCTYKENFDDIKIINKIVFNFKDNTYNKIDTMVFKNNDDALEYFNDIYEYQEEYNLILDKNKIVSNTTGDIKLDGTKNNIKNQYKNYDYKCK